MKKLTQDECCVIVPIKILANYNDLGIELNFDPSLRVGRKSTLISLSVILKKKRISVITGMKLPDCERYDILNEHVPWERTSRF